METTLQEQADADYAHILELVRDYLSLVAAVKVNFKIGYRLSDKAFKLGGSW